MSGSRSIMQGWPDSLIRLSEVIGVANALRLVEAYGGVEDCFVPGGRLHSGLRLVQVVGLDAAAKMQQAYGTGALEIPNLRIARTRKAMIAQAEGNVSEIARRLGVTRRWVRQVRNGGKGDSRQIDMFAAPDAE